VAGIRARVGARRCSLPLSLILALPLPRSLLLSLSLPLVPRNARGGARHRSRGPRDAPPTVLPILELREAREPEILMQHTPAAQDASTVVDEALVRYPVESSYAHGDAYRAVSLSLLFG
jgi:hypothetical protein